MSTLTNEQRSGLAQVRAGLDKIIKESTGPQGQLTDVGHLAKSQRDIVDILTHGVPQGD